VVDADQRPSLSGLAAAGGLLALAGLFATWLETDEGWGDAFWAHGGWATPAWVITVVGAVCAGCAILASLGRHPNRSAVLGALAVEGVAAVAWIGLAVAASV
jgi:hypothetical protein